MSRGWEEAVRRFPPESVNVERIRDELLTTARTSFAAGVDWQREHPVEVTDEMVHRGVRGLLNCGSARAGKLVRAILEAALGTSHNSDDRALSRRAPRGSKVDAEQISGNAQALLGMLPLRIIGMRKDNRNTIHALIDVVKHVPAMAERIRELEAELRVFHD